ncbi:unnamed protein product [Lathyrus sativus]|nr:unnamed protein product [Lathyrus sativus]
MSDIQAVVWPIIFREYITDGLDALPANIINNNMGEFHFILGFATETYLEDGTGTGAFTRTWNFDDFSPSKLLTLKEEHPNVKVIMNIGGHGDEYVFNPRDKEEWIVNAKSSIKGLILDYQIQTIPVSVSAIDGIDINYENIKSNADDFAYCIGKVIQQLKEDPLVFNSTNVSISPTEVLRPHYLKLYLENKDNINWINYKFYNQSIESEIDFAKLFKILVFEYGAPYKLLPGVSTNTSSPPLMPIDVFVAGCKILLKTKSLAGVFVWDANESAPEYSLEEVLQKLLT